MSIGNALIIIIIIWLYVLIIEWPKGLGYWVAPCPVTDHILHFMKLHLVAVEHDSMR